METPHPNPRPRMVTGRQDRCPMKPRESWWLDRPREGFTDTARRESFNTHPDTQPKHKPLSI